MLQFASTEMTHPGSVREVNEDSVLSMTESCLWAVADGMGGYEAGDVASKMLVDSLNQLSFDDQTLSKNIEAIEETIIEVNKKIIDHSNDVFEGRVFGSTIVVTYIENNTGFVFWAGDSRLYRLRDNELKRITRDHSQLQEMLDSNLLLPEEIENYPDHNVITRAVGAEEELILDFMAFEIEDDDKFLLCSDGLYNALDEDLIQNILNIGNINLNSQQLISEALEAGASDNVSFILIQNSDGQTITNVKVKS